MKFFAVLLCVFLAGSQRSQARMFPAPLVNSHTPNGVMFPGWQDGNEWSKTGDDTQSPTARIVGGTEAEKHEFPWLVSIQMYNKEEQKYHQHCGGSVIDEWWIMTAAHCFKDEDTDFKIVAGEHKISATEDGEQHHKLKCTFIHPEYDPSTTVNDIALLKLSEKLKLDGKTVAPICLPTPLLNSTGECVVAGWGETNDENHFDVLMKVTVPIVSDKECKEIFQCSNYKFLENMICAGYKEGGKDSCTADSGGPLVCKRDANMYYQAGVVSWGKGCGEPNSPGVYTEVSYFVDWINKVRNQE